MSRLVSRPGDVRLYLVNAKWTKGEREEEVCWEGERGRRRDGHGGRSTIGESGGDGGPGDMQLWMAR